VQQLGFVPQISWVPYHVEKTHRKTVLSSYIGFNYPKIKVKLIYVDVFSQSSRMDAKRAW